MRFFCDVLPTRLVAMNQEQLTLRFGVQQSLHWMAVGITIPILTLFFQSRGLSLADVGLVMAAWIGTTTLLEIPLGAVADSYGRRRTYLASLLINILGYVALYFAEDLSFILLAAMVLGAARAVYSGTLDAWFYDNFQRRQGKLSFHSALARVNVMVTMGLAVGALIGGELPDYAVSTSLKLASKYDLNIMLAAMANVLLIWVTLGLVDEKRQPNQEKTVMMVSTAAIFTDVSIPIAITAKMNYRSIKIMIASLQTLKASLHHDVLKRLLQTTFVFGMVLSSVENHWQPYLANILQGTSYGVTVFGIIAAIYFLMSATSSLLSVRLLCLFNGSHKRLMLTTRALAGVVFVMLAHTSHLMSFTLGYLTFFFLFSAGNNSESVLLNENTDANVRSTMLSISSFIVTIGGVIASLLFGMVSELYGIAVSWMICGGLLLVSSALFELIPEKVASQKIQIENNCRP